MAGPVRVALVLLVMLLAPPVFAATYYTSKSGNNGNSCTTAQSPGSSAKLTIGGALSCVSGSGHTVLIQAGTYNERISHTQYPNGTTIARDPNAPLKSVMIKPISGNGDVISGFGRTNITIRGLVVDARTNTQGNDLPNANAINLYGIRDMGDGAVIEDNEVFGSQAYPNGNCIGVAHPSTGVIVRRNDVHHCLEYGMYWGGNNGLVEDNHFHDNGGFGIHSYADDSSDVSNNTFRRNRFTRNGHHSYNVAGEPSQFPAFILGTGSGNVLHDSIFDSNYVGLQIWGAGNQVYSNSFFGNTNGCNAQNECYGHGCIVLGPFGNPSGTIARNNICYGNETNAIDVQVGNLTQSNNLFSNPFWVNTAGGSFKIATAGSPAINGGFTLGAPFNTDIEGLLRPAGQYTIGAHQFAGEVVQPIGNFAKWTFEEGTGTSAADSSGQNHTCTLNTAGWGAGIVGSFSLNANGVRECHVTNTTGMRPTSIISGSVWLNGLPNGDYGYLVDMGGAWGLWHDPNGNLVFFINAGAQYVLTSGNNILTGTNRHVAFTKDAGALRIWIDGAQTPTITLTTTPLGYSGSEVLYIGRNALQVGNYFPGRIDQVYLFDTPLDQTLVTQLFNEVVPVVGMSVTHSRFSHAGQAEGMFSVPVDTDDVRLVGQPVGIRWAIHRGDAGSLTEYFRVFCRVNSGAGYGSWTEVGNSFLGLGIRFYTDGSIALGQPTNSTLLPLDGATAVPGLFLENPVDTTAPYDAGQRLTIALGQHAELEARLELSAPLVATNTVQCRPQRENATVFESYGGAGDPAIRTLTLAVPNVARALMGVQVIGGSVQ